MKVTNWLHYGALHDADKHALLYCCVAAGRVPTYTGKEKKDKTRAAAAPPLFRYLHQRVLYFG